MSCKDRLTPTLIGLRMRPHKANPSFPKGSHRSSDIVVTREASKNKRRRI